MRTVQKILDLLSRREKKQACIILGMILIMALLDMLGVASILPFVAVLANPEIVNSNELLNNIYVACNQFGIETLEEFLLVMGIGIFILLLASLGFKALTTYAQLRFTLMREFSIGKRLIEGYLHQPYSWFLNRHSADLGKTILSEVNTVVFGAINPMMNLVAQSVVVMLLLILLLLIDPLIALFVTLGLGIAFTLVFKSVRHYLKHIGGDRVKANEERFAVVVDAFGASKEVKVGGLERTFVKRFSKPAQQHASYQATAQVVGQLPRYALEAIAFGGMLLVILYLMSKERDFASTIPVISLYAFAGYRLMPALQQVYLAATQLRFAGPALDVLHEHLTEFPYVDPNTASDPMTVRSSIALDRVRYTYPNASRPALREISLTIQAKTTVGLVGPTGSGKTTALDVILGLLQAQSGTLSIDGEIIAEHNHRVWQRAIGYVPQRVYLADDTVAANIAFGLDAEDIDQTSVERAAKIACLHDFVVNELPGKYQTKVGERGVRLSGGQCQRIGIARALYRVPQVLILDEATSALDNLTERAIIENISFFGQEITIIFVAHRLSTVKGCDMIFYLEDGELVAQGDFQNLMQTSEKFNALATGRK